MKNEKEYYIQGELTEDCQWIKIHHHLILEPIFKDWVGKILDISVKVFFQKRTHRQNRYLHGVILPCVISWARETRGELWSKEKAKSFIYMEVLGYEIGVDNIDGREIFWFEGKRFSEMNTKQFGESKEQLQEYFGQRGKYIPDPVGNNTLNEIIINEHTRKSNP